MAHSVDSTVSGERILMTWHLFLSPTYTLLRRAGGCRTGADFVAAVLIESSITMKVESSVRRRLPWPSDTDDDPKLTHVCSFLQGASEGKVVRSVVSVYPLLSLYLVRTN